MKKVAIIGLVVLILLVGMPLAMGMGGMAPCPDCPATTSWSVIGLCAAVLSFFALLVLLASTNMTLLLTTVRAYLLVRRLDRPPRLV
jgi:hypothetical protein